MGKPTFDSCKSKTSLTPIFFTEEHQFDIGGFGLTVIIMKVSKSEYIGFRSEPGELKHLSTQRKGHQRDSVSSGERTRTRPVVIFTQPERIGKFGLSG